MLYQLSYCPKFPRALNSPSGRQDFQSYHRAPKGYLAGLFVGRVLAIEATELLHLDALTVIQLVFHGDVVAALAVLACEGHLDSLVIFRHVCLLTNWVHLFTTARPNGPPSSGGGSRTRDTTIMSRVL